MSDYRALWNKPPCPAIPVCRGDIRDCRVPFLVPPESSGASWELRYASATGRPGTFEIGGQLDEAEALSVAGDHLLKHGWLTVTVEVEPEDGFYVLAP